jgi:alpha-glucosidase
MRHTWLVYPGTEAADADLQFFLGDHLLMAPVTSNDATSTEVSLPPGEWVHAFTGEQFSGDQTVTVPSPLGTPAAFVRADDPVGAQIREALTDAGLTTG